MVAPNWLKGTPFDVARFFALPPDFENAAPLYLDALFEFGPELAQCFPPDQRGRAADAKARSERFQALYPAWDENSKSVPVEQIDALLAGFHEGFRKLDLAQRRPRCVFATGLDFEAPVPHAQVARTVAKLWRVRASRACDRGDFDAAIADLERILRLSRDVRARGMLLCQLNGIVIDALAFDRMIMTFLNHPKLKASDCDRLLQVVTGHEAQALDFFSEGVKAQFVHDRSYLRMFVDGFKTTIDEEARPVETRIERAGVVRELVLTILASQVAEELVEDGRPKPGDDQRRERDLFAIANTMIDEAKAEPRWGDEFTRCLLAAKASYADRMVVFRATERPHDQGGAPGWFKIVADAYKTLILSCSRDQVYRGAAKCRIALRRWQLTHDVAPTDLAEVCRAAALPGVPVDSFSGSTLKMAVIDGDPVIYSIGDDGRDDQALKDARLGRNPGTAGDYLFRLPKQK